jgi:hypothetical protein
MKIRIVLLLLVTGLTLSALAAEAPAASATNASAAFARLKGLVGTWQADTDMGKLQVTYELVSGGNVLLERIAAESPEHHNMVTTYYLDGDALALTHYCETGNVPHMVARKINIENGEIAFDFAGAANLTNPNAPHMHSATFRLVDADHFTSAWTMFENNKPKFTITAPYVRVN